MPVRFLVVRFSSIGDIVLTTPVIRGIKTQVEEAEVHFVTKKQFYQVVSDNPYIDKIHLLDGNLNSLIETLRNEEIDYIIDLHHNIRSFILKQKLGLISFSFNKINIQKWLRVALKINFLPDKHIVDRYLETCYLFDVQNDMQGLDFFIHPTNEIDTKQISSELSNGYVAIVIGAMHATKQMPDDMLARLCTLVKKPVVLLGGTSDTDKAEQIINLAKKLSISQLIYNACGKFNIQQSASIIKQATVVITHDTGLMHIAAAFKKPIISLWGNTIPEFGMYPYMPGHDHYIFENKRLWCRPCSKIGYKKCPLGHFKCMREISVEKVAETCNKLIEYNS